MIETGAFRVLLTLPAKRDFSSIIRLSFREFGEEAAYRYEALIMQAFDDLAMDPERLGAKAHPELMIAGARTYHLSFSRFRVEGIAVKSPRHFLLYRLNTPGNIEIARILHDSRNLQKHLPKSYKRM